MGERFLNINLGTSLPNWCNENKCDLFDSLSNVFARAYVMIEFYKFFLKNGASLNIESTNKADLGNLDKEKKYLIDIF